MISKYINAMKFFMQSLKMRELIIIAVPRLKPIGKVLLIP